MIELSDFLAYIVKNKLSDILLLFDLLRCDHEFCLMKHAYYFLMIIIKNIRG